VPNRLGRGHQSDVTAFAVVGDGPMVHSRRFPEASRVAVVAVCLNRNMTGRAAGLGAVTRPSMAQITLEWRSYELPIDVATLARDPLMSSGEWKPREVMIKGRRGLCCCNRGQQ
jgi:hypothetical protein